MLLLPDLKTGITFVLFCVFGKSSHDKGLKPKQNGNFMHDYL